MKLIPNMLSFFGKRPFLPIFKHQIISEEYYSGMTVNERLWNSHNFNRFVQAEKEHDIEAIIRIAREIHLDRTWQVDFLKQKGWYSRDVDYHLCMSNAERADVDGNYLEAIYEYEKIIVSSPFLAAYINLAHLYWRSIPDNPNMFTCLRIPESVRTRAEQRMKEILTMCCKKYCRNSDGPFWSEYYDSCDKGKNHSEIEWLKIIENFSDYGPASNQMYFVCYLYDKEKYASEIADFLEECERCPTALNLYIKEQMT